MQWNTRTSGDNNVTQVTEDILRLMIADMTNTELRTFWVGVMEQWGQLAPAWLARLVSHRLQLDTSPLVSHTGRQEDNALPDCSSPTYTASFFNELEPYKYN